MARTEDELTRHWQRVVGATGRCVELSEWRADLVYGSRHVDVDIDRALSTLKHIRDGAGVVVAVDILTSRGAVFSNQVRKD